MATHSESHAEHPHFHAPSHWEWSTAPTLIVLGIFFSIPLAFAGHFVYHNSLMTSVFAGLGVPVLLWGISQWVSEGINSPESHHHGLSKVGLPIFIVSEVWIFIGLFSAYWALRLMAAQWPPDGTPHIGTNLPIIMTILLVSSSATIHVAEEKLEEGDVGGMKTWLILTLLLGTVFLGCTLTEYSKLIGEGFVPSTNAYSTAFFSITGFHASHVLVGLVTFLCVLIPALSGKTNKTFLACASVYWHFVDIVWFFVVSQIYFW
ncbi:MAG: heme-copper oxidase subunit III [Nitrospinae bacterium]|nr:heme-copper oxidase subunit III [Nitrospinota bacterium]